MRGVPFKDNFMNAMIILGGVGSLLVVLSLCIVNILCISEIRKSLLWLLSLIYSMIVLSLSSLIWVNQI